MKCKTLEIKVELEIAAVTCPGVWLCSNGKVTLDIYMLESGSQTHPVEPVFPLTFHEKLTFKKTYLHCRKLNDIEQYLNKGIFYAELIQWESCKNGLLLATFRSSLMDILYPASKYEDVALGTDIDLLMEATKNFPGIISPKIEVSTRTAVEEVLCTYKDQTNSHMICVNPRVISSKRVPKRPIQFRQKKVCHSHGYHKTKSLEKPSKLFTEHEKYSSKCQAEQDSHRCKCSARSHNEAEDLRTKMHSLCPESVTNESQNLSHKYDAMNKIKPSRTCRCEKRVICPICTKYKYYFEDSPRKKHHKSNADKESPCKNKAQKASDRAEPNAGETNLCKCNLDYSEEFQAELKKFYNQLCTLSQRPASRGDHCLNTCRCK